jgi:uncharacterized protein (TIGR03663 family)
MNSTPSSFLHKPTVQVANIAFFILLGGALLRLWRLGDFPFHPDEAIHAWFALGLREYHYDPVYHGPLLYHLIASVFGLLGASDYTARLVPALLGIGLLWMVLFPAREYLGERAALWSGALLAVSPVIVAYSRRLLHDSLVMVLTLGAVLCFQAALEHPSSTERGRNARIGLAAILALFLATKANVFFIEAMLAIFWGWHCLLQARKEKRISFDWQTLLLGLVVAALILVMLFRSETLRALPAMLEYWGGQQRKPRLPGPNDYYFRLFAVYELPLFLAAIWGMFQAVRRPTRFTDLLLWWSLTSLGLYAIANEKVPWLLAHQVLPLALLAGYGLAQIEFISVAKRYAVALIVACALVFSLRHVVATNFEAAADRHDPLFFAQTTQAYRDAMTQAMQKARNTPGDVWIEPSQQWPAGWYLRSGAPILGQKEAKWDEKPPSEENLTVFFSSMDEWESLQSQQRFVSWKSYIVPRYVWQRPAWTALYPATFWRFWSAREASRDNGVLAEQSENFSMINLSSEVENKQLFSSD